LLSATELQRADALAVDPVVEMRGVELRYPGPPAVDALRGCDLRVLAGEFVAIMGRSGAGKTTLLNLLGLLDRPTRGTYVLNGVDTATYRERERAVERSRHIGFVFQSYHLLPNRAACENVELALLYGGCPRGDRRRRSLAILDEVGLSRRAYALATQLSGGERQRVAFARALVNRPSLLLCDEPTGNLDSTTTAQVLAMMHDLNARGQTVVVITHDPAVAAQAGRTLRLTDGVIEDGGGNDGP
jgi:putative ABC transport system ATP-binding protein